MALKKMNIVFVLHDLNLTGAPRLGLQIAQEFAKENNVTLISKRDGPLGEGINKIFNKVITTNTHHEHCKTSLDKRIDDAATLLKKYSPDLVYVNSMAAADWLSAAIKIGCKNVLHIHEMEKEIIGLEGMKVFDRADISRADLIVTASETCLLQSQSIFQFPLNKTYNLDVCVNIEEITEKSTLKVEDPKNFAGEKLKINKPIIAMCGVACDRKGSDIFYETAKLCPQFDFLWVGPWDDSNANKVNTALSLQAKNPLSNLYWTNTTNNPYAYIKKADYFVLTSREDPNPLVIPESIALGVRTIAFSHTGGSHIWTNRFGITLSGEVSASRIVKLIEKCNQLGPNKELAASMDLFKTIASFSNKFKYLTDALENTTT